VIAVNTVSTALPCSLWWAQGRKI